MALSKFVNFFYFALNKHFKLRSTTNLWRQVRPSLSTQQWTERTWAAAKVLWARMNSVKVCIVVPNLVVTILLAWKEDFFFLGAHVRALCAWACGRRCILLVHMVLVDVIISKRWKTLWACNSWKNCAMDLKFKTRAHRKQHYRSITKKHHINFDLNSPLSKQDEDGFASYLLERLAPLGIT